MLSAGADMKQFQKNPVLLWMHQRPWRGTRDEVLVIGRCKDIRLEGDQWKCELEFDSDDAFAKEVERKWDKGFYRMVSPGLTPLEYSKDPKYMLKGQSYATVSKWRLDEVSVVDIGGNDNNIAIKNAESGEYVTLSDNSDISFIPKVELKSEIKMSEIAKKLGLSQDASESEMLTAIDQLQVEGRQLKDDNEKVLLNSINTAVDSAVREERITAEQKDHFVELGQKTGLDFLQKTLSGIEPIVKPTEMLSHQSGGKKKEQEDKKFSDYSVEELLNLKDEDPGKYKLLFEKEYGFLPEV